MSLPRLFLNHYAEQAGAEGARKILVCDHEGEKLRLESDEILIAPGRTPDIRGLGLEELGIDPGQDHHIQILKSQGLVLMKFRQILSMKLSYAILKNLTGLLPIPWPLVLLKF